MTTIVEPSHQRLDGILWTLLGMASLGPFLLNCAPIHVRLEGTSVESHRSQAASERKQAEAHRQQFVPSATRALMSEGPEGALAADFSSYNPTRWQLDEAVRHT